MSGVLCGLFVEGWDPRPGLRALALNRAGASPRAGTLGDMGTPTPALHTESLEDAEKLAALLTYRRQQQEQIQPGPRPAMGVDHAAQFREFKNDMLIDGLRFNHRVHNELNRMQQVVGCALAPTPRDLQLGGGGGGGGGLSPQKEAGGGVWNRGTNVRVVVSTQPVDLWMARKSGRKASRTENCPEILFPMTHTPK